MRRLAHGLLIVGFLVGISLPALQGLFLHRQDILSNENRPAAVCPRFAWSERKWFVPMFEAFFSDHFGYRTELLAVHRTIQYDLFNRSVHPNVVVGREGWLYYDFDKAGIHDDAQREPLASAVLAWQAAFQRREQELAAQGMAFAVLVAPEKQTIYPEYQLRRHQRRLQNHTPFDALAAAYPIIDVRPTLRAGKTDEAMYYAGDTHWTDAGVIRVVAQLQTPLGLDQRSLMYQPHFWERPKDLRRMMALPDAQQTEWSYYYALLTPLQLQRQIYTPPSPIPNAQPNIDAMVFDNPESTGPRVVLLHDSFGESLREKLALRCRRLVCIPTASWASAIIQHEQPDLVLIEMAERKIVLPVTIDR